MPASILVVLASDFKKVCPLIKGRDFKWVYLGQYIEKREKISGLLGNNNRFSLGDLLQEVALKQTGPYLSFLRDLGQIQRNKLHWWASNTARRYPQFKKDLYLLWCYKTVFEKVCLGKKKVDKFLIVIIEDRWLYQHLWEQVRKSESHLNFLSQESLFLEITRTVLLGIAGRCLILARAACYSLLTRHSNSKKQGVSSTGNEKHVYIYSWVLDKSFDEGNNFTDIYFGRLPQILTRSGFEVSYVAPLFIPGLLKKKGENNKNYRFHFLDRYIHFIDILKCLFVSFRINYDNRYSNLKTLIRRQALTEISAVSGHMLYYFAFKRWLKEIPHNKFTIIYPFENQPWEKMLCMAARELDQKIKLVGYQHSTVQSLEMNYFLAPEELNQMPLPDVIVTSGEYAKELLNNLENEKLKVINGGALRYEHLYKKEKELITRIEGPKTILVVLPSFSNIAQEMLLSMFYAFKDDKKFRFLIKPHPVVPVERLKFVPSNWPEHFEKTDKSITDALKETHLLIYSSSSAGLEALKTGIPIIKYCSELNIDLDPMNTLQGESGTICSETNLRQAVLSLLEGNTYDPAQHASAGAGRISRFFSAVDEKVWKELAQS